MYSMVMPLKERDAEVILSSVKGGFSDGLLLTLPRNAEWLPFMTVPHQICANILRNYLS